MKKIKEDDFGMLKWVDCGSGSGFWERIEDPEMVEARVPQDCPACRQGLDNWAIQNFYHRNGVCADCSILYLEHQLEGKWVSRFPEGFFKTRTAKVEFCKLKNEERLKRILSEKNNI